MQSDYKGYFIKFGDKQLPNSFLDSYSSTPNQRTEKKAWRDNNNYLRRVTSPNFKTTLDPEIRSLSQNEKDLLENIKSNGLVDEDQRKYNVTFWNMETGKYTTAEMYIPDTTYKISHVANNDTGEMYYDSFTLEMIQY